MEETTTSIFYHPLMGKQPPSIENLRIRCEGMKELKILEDACKLAAYRQYRETVLLEAYDAYHREPFHGYCLRKPKKRPFALTETDLLRALLANEPHLIKKTFLNEIQVVIKGFDQDVYYWQHIIKNFDLQTLPLNLDLRWGRRWALALMRVPEKIISMETWAGSVVDAVITAARGWDMDYMKGFITKKECELRVRYSLNKTLKWKLPCIPAAYYNRENLLSAIEERTKEGPGILLVGKRGSGLFSLMKTFAYRLIYDMSDHPLRDYSAVVYAGTFSHISSIECIEEAREFPCLYGSTCDITEEEVGSTCGFCSPEHQLSERAENTDRILRLLSETSRTSQCCLMMLTVDPEELDTLLEAVPATKNFSQIHVPPLEDPDLLPILLAKLPYLVDNLTDNCDLNLLVRIVYQLAIAHPDKLSAYEIGRLLLNPPDPDACDLGLLSPYVKTKFSHVYLKRYYQGVKSSKKYGWFCDRFIGSQDNLTQLIEGEKVLKEMCAAVYRDLG